MAALEALPFGSKILPGNSAFLPLTHLTQEKQRVSLILLLLVADVEGSKPIPTGGPASPGMRASPTALLRDEGTPTFLSPLQSAPRGGKYYFCNFFIF